MDYQRIVSATQERPVRWVKKMNRPFMIRSQTEIVSDNCLSSLIFGAPLSKSQIIGLDNTGNSNNDMMELT